ncbi:MAG: TonB-dependent receptor [Gemmatimonadaceae bacterium]|nr:TonB-dependent receptor [Gemmatimonadaceae bacterium]
MQRDFVLRLARIVALSMAAAVAAPVAAQPAADSIRTVLRGVVRLPNAQPARDVAVALLEGSESAVTDSAGAFTLRSTHRGLGTVVARRIGFHPAALDVVVPLDTLVTLVLVPQPPSLTTMTVVAAGEYTLGGGTTAALSPLDVVQTPGAAGNVARALQTLPGPQAVDEGSGLFVRGGDVTETRVLVDDAWLLSPARFDNPLGHVTATVDPFLLDRTVFSAGGFGARYGNALSGLVRLETAGRPKKREGSATLSIGNAGVAVAAAPSSRLGVRASANINSLGPVTATFGQAQPFDPPPQGGDLSGTIEWATGRAGRVRLFAVREGARVGVGDAGVQVGSSYAARSTQHMTVLSWRDSATAWRPAVTLAHSGFTRREDLTGLRLGTALGVTHLVSSLGWRSDRGIGVTVGADLERLEAGYDGTLAAGRTDSVRVLFDAQARSDRTGAFVEGTWQDVRGVRVIAGVRTDRATITGQRTVDPRVSMSWQRGRLGLTAAAGVLHQVAEPTFFRPRDGARDFAPMRVREVIVGAQLGTDSAGLRLELYDKRYDNLWQFTRDFGVAGGARGHARGADLFARWQFGATTRSRLSWSIVRSRRDDPHTGLDAPALGDVTHSVAWITDRQFGRLRISSALRYATGRPFTDVVGTTRAEGVVEPVWGAPNASRFPAYLRSDLSASWYRPLDGTRAVVLWGSLSNLFDRTNVMRYFWSADYTERYPVRAPFNRVLYAGATLLF